MLSPHILDERISDGKRKHVKSSSLLKGHDTQEEKPTSCSHPTDKSLEGEGFLATQAANHAVSMTMRPDYWKDILLPSLPLPWAWKAELDSRTKLVSSLLYSVSTLLFTHLADQMLSLLTSQDTENYLPKRRVIWNHLCHCLPLPFKANQWEANSRVFRKNLFYVISKQKSFPLSLAPAVFCLHHRACALPAVETGTTRWRPKPNRITGPIL